MCWRSGRASNESFIAIIKLGSDKKKVFIDIPQGFHPLNRSVQPSSSHKGNNACSKRTIMVIELIFSQVHPDKIFVAQSTGTRSDCRLWVVVCTFRSKNVTEGLVQNVTC